jgi:Protein of unknown function (DUF2442)
MRRTIRAADAEPSSNSQRPGVGCLRVSTETSARQQSWQLLERRHAHDPHVLRYLGVDVLSGQPIDGTHRRFDMKPLLSVKPWNKVSTLPLFMQAKVAYGTVIWPGEIDIAPETLLLDSVLLQAV